MKPLIKWITVLTFIITSYNNVFGGQKDSVIEELEELISRGESASLTQFELLKNKIEENPNKILPLLLLKANTPNLPEKDLAIYIWAIGLTKSPEAIDDIIRLSNGKKSEILVSNVYKALAAIGGKKAGKYLFEKLKETTDPMMRYYLIDILAQIQYEPALSTTIEVLKKDPKRYYWQSIFVFGKYGDIAIPFLLKKVSDANENIRKNSIMVLGQWLIALEAITPMKKQYWEESKPEIRMLILSSLERINSDLNDVNAFSEEVIKKEKDKKVVQFAKETINHLNKINSNITSFKSNKKNDRSLFESEYNKIYNSFGKKGNYDNLAATSTKADEKRLKKLKEVILQRNSDECFYDYQKVNNIIMFNRII